MKLILVEDNPDLVESMRILLELLGYEVECYLRALDLLEQAHQLGDDDVIVSDYYLPDMNGVELIRRVRQQRPAVKSILLTGSREDGIVKAARSIPGCSLLYKPLEAEALEQSIRQLHAPAAPSPLQAARPRRA